MGVEGNDAERVFLLARHQVGEDSLKVSCLGVGLAPNGAKTPQIILRKVDRLIVAGGHDRGRPAATRHTQNSTLTDPEKIGAEGWNCESLAWLRPEDAAPVGGSRDVWTGAAPLTPGMGQHRTINQRFRPSKGRIAALLAASSGFLLAAQQVGSNVT